MTPKQIKEGNEKIALFMGYWQPELIEENNIYSFQVWHDFDMCNSDTGKGNIIHYNDGDIEDPQFMDDAEYHRDWNWLMKVVGKIYDSDSYYRYVCETSGQFENKIELTTSIKNVYDQVVDFIDWHNDNK